MASKPPPKVLQPVVAHLHRAAAHAAPERARALRSYNFERLRRDRVAKLVPLPGRNGVGFGDALLAAGIAALGRRAGKRHRCPALEWYLLALNPEPEALQELRARLGEALDRLPGRLGTNARPMAVTLAHEEFLNTSSAHRATEVRAALLEQLTQVDGLPLPEARDDIDRLFPGKVDRRSNAIALREVKAKLDNAFGSELTSEALTALGPPSRRLSDGAGPLYDFILDAEGLGADPDQAVRATDPDYVRTLLATADDGRLRHTVWQFCRPAAPFGGCEHRGQDCKPACDHAAWLLCVHLDPAQLRRWELANSPADRSCSWRSSMRSAWPRKRPFGPARR